MINSENKDDEVISVGYLEKEPGTHESYAEIASYMEFSSNAIDALGDLMVCVEEDKLKEYTVQA